MKVGEGRIRASARPGVTAPESRGWRALLGFVLLGVSAVAPFGGGVVHAQESAGSAPSTPSPSTPPASAPSASAASSDVALSSDVDGERERSELDLGPRESLDGFVGRKLDDVQVRMLGALWPEEVQLTTVRVGETIAPDVGRRALRELAASGRFADLRAELIDDEGKTRLVVEARPRRLIAQVRLEGSGLVEGEAIRALGMARDDEVTDLLIVAAERRVRRAHAEAGYPNAIVQIDAQDTDDPRRVVVRVRVVPGELQRITELRILVRPSPSHPRLGPLLDRVEVRAGQPRDRARVEEAVEKLTKELVAAGFYEAHVDFDLPHGGVVELRVDAGRWFRVRIEGNERFGDDELEAELNLDRLREPNPDLLEPVLRKFYVKHGFLDATVRFLRLDSPDGLSSELYGWVREGRRFQVEERLFPCALGTRTRSDLDAEVDGVLAEQFPETPFVEPPPSTSLDPALTGQKRTVGADPLPSAPYESYSEAAYQAVRTHLENLYRSEGYLGAEVGPLTLARRQCARDSQPNECRVTGPRPLPVIDCARPPAADTRQELHETCVPDAERGIRCEPEGTLVVPIYPGRQAVLYDVRIEGNVRFTERELFEASELELGEPVRREAIDIALRNLRDMYAEEAYAFAQLDSDLELSPDRTRARLVLSVTERQQVTVRRIDVRGAKKTREGLIRSRIALAPNELYRKSAIEKSQRQIESLGVFTSVSVGFEDPGVPAREKVVVVTVNERPSQYVDIKGGFSTGEGFRIGFEYGHRNLGGEAIQLTARSQLGIRPPILIVEDDVRLKYEQLSLGELLERRNTLTVAFPETGLGPLFRLEIEGLDAHTNQRDFAQTRDAGIVRLLFRPEREWFFQTGATVELNEARIFFTGDARDSLEDFIRENPDFGRTIRVPEGRSVAITQNVQGTWDRRDRALAAHRGTYLSTMIEHVTAVPVDERAGQCDETATGPFDAACSELLRFSGRAAGYVPLSERGLTLAMSVRSGVIQHLSEDSRTYPDRLFFVGGVDSIRSYPQDSLVPQDIADQLLAPNSDLTISDVALRGGDFFFNPRIELRIPLVGSVETALFLDAANLWADRTQLDLLKLRYAIGTGIRIETPVGPLVFDYGFNVDRVLDAIFPARTQQRTWESLGAFHFSIGLF